MFSYLDQSLHCEQAPLADIARSAGTPCYVYSSGTILENYRAYDEGLGDLPHTVCYAVKANGSLAILSLLANAGAGGVFIYGCELDLVLHVELRARHRVFGGAGATACVIG